MARRYARDNKGRFASTGSGATARGGRLKTASGAKRDTQTIKASAGLRSTVAKPKGLKPGAIKPKQSSKPASKPKFEKIPQGAGRRTAALSGGRRLNISTDGKTFSASLIGKDGAPRMERRGLRNVTAAKAWAANPNARGPRLLGGGLKTEASPKATWTRNARPVSTIGKPKGLKPGAIQPRAATKPAARRDKLQNGPLAGAGDFVKQGLRGMGNRAINRVETAARLSELQKAGKLNRLSPSQSRRAQSVFNDAQRKVSVASKIAAEQRQIQLAIKADKMRRGAAAKPAAKPVAQKPLARSGQKLTVQRFRTNAEMGRKGVVSMSAHSKAVRRGDVAERRAERLSQITERQSGIIARRQINRASTYRPDGSFDQSAANLNQRKLNRSKALQQQLATAATGASMAQSALSRRRQAVTKSARAAATPRTGQEIMKAEVRKVQNKKIRDLNKQIKEAGPNAAGLRLQKLQVQSRLDATRPRQTAKQAAKSAKQTEAVRGRIAEMRRQNARIGRATANKERTADTTGQAGSKMIRRPSQKMTRANNLADRALNFYANPAKALREVRKNRPGFRMPRTMR